MPWLDYVWATITLCAWWGAWCLADTYLLQFTPWSELAAIVSIGWQRCCTQRPQRYSVELREESKTSIAEPC